MFKRRERVRFYEPTRDLKSILGSATARARARGTDSLDFLAAAAASRSVAKVLRRLGVDATVVAQAADQARSSTSPDPGLQADARAVFEALLQRSLQQQRDPKGRDLLVALASVDTPAQIVLQRFGVDEARLRAILGDAASSGHREFES
jgi:hypothetical protein